MVAITTRLKQLPWYIQLIVYQLAIAMINCSYTMASSCELCMHYIAMT